MDGASLWSHSITQQLEEPQQCNAAQNKLQGVWAYRQSQGIILSHGRENGNEWDLKVWITHKASRVHSYNQQLYEGIILGSFPFILPLAAIISDLFYRCFNKMWLQGLILTEEAALVKPAGLWAPDWAQASSVLDSEPLFPLSFSSTDFFSTLKAFIFQS